MPTLSFINPPQTTDSPDTHIARISVATGRGFSDVRGTSATTHVPFTSSNASSSASNITTAPDSGKTLVITDLIISSDTAMNLVFTEETTSTVLLKIFIAANTSFHFNPTGKFKLNTADKKLQVTASTSGNISILAFYYSE